MNSIRIFIFIFLFLILFKISYIQVNGHGLSTDISNPVDVPGKKIVVEAKLELHILITLLIILIQNFY